MCLRSILGVRTTVIVITAAIVYVKEFVSFIFSYGLFFNFTISISTFTFSDGFQKLFEY